MGHIQAIFAVGTLCLVTVACGASSTSKVAFDGVDAKAAEMLKGLSPEDLETGWAPPPDQSNQYADDERAAELGQRWFFDKGFSGQLLDADNDGDPETTLGKQGETGRVACSGCHLPEAGFSDTRSRGRQISLGTAWGKRRTPSLLDIGHARLIMWDGRHDALYNQVFGPIEADFEMNSSRLFVAQRIWLEYRAEYEEIFGPLPDFADTERFPRLSAKETGCQRSVSMGQPRCRGMPGDKAEYDGLSASDQREVTRVVVNFGKAIGAYERKLSCGSSRFDAWAHGEPDALSDAEKRGAELFVGRGQCVKCHSGPLMSDQRFHNVGLIPAVVAVAFIDLDDRGAEEGLTAALTDPLNVRGIYSDGDDGRLPKKVTPEMAGAFRTPTLRCVSQRPTFMHTGQVSSLKATVQHFNRPPGGSLIGRSEVSALGLSDSEIEDLVAFLVSLDGPGPDKALKREPR